MTNETPPPVDAGDMKALAKPARLALVAGRPEIVAGALTGMLASFDALDAVDVGETAPTNSFDPRWRDAE